MLFMLAALVLMTAAILGWGHFVAAWCQGRRTLGSDAEPASVALIGLYVLTLVGQAAPFLGPRSFLAGILFLLSGAALLARPDARLWLKSNLRWLAVLAAFDLAMGLYMATHVHVWGDPALYHLPFIRWTAEDGVVVGLGNIHGRHGFNSSWLSTAALFSTPRSWAYGPLLFCVAGECLLYAGLLARSAWAVSANRPACAVFGFVASLMLLRVVPGLDRFTWITNTDHPAILLILHCLMLSVSIMESSWRKTETGENAATAFSRIEVLALIAALAVAVTTQLSGLPAALFLFAVVPLADVRAAVGAGLSKHKRSLIACSLLLVAVPAVWCLRTFLISGCLVYPMAITCVPVPWFVGWDVVQNEMAWAVSWARITPIPPSDPIFVGFKWVATWATSFDIVRVSVRAGAVLLLAVAIALVQRMRGQHWMSSAVVLPIGVSIVGLIMWFFGAPDIRFGAAFIIGAVALPLAGAMASLPCFSRGAIALAAAIWVINFAYLLTVGVHHDGASLAGEITLTQPDSEVRTTSSGLQVRVTKDEDRCWMLPNPCLPAYTDIAKHALGPYTMYTRQH